MVNGIEIFSGAGGLATGLGLAGISHHAFVEWNRDACRTLRQNYDPSIVNNTDIRTFDFTPFRGIDFIAGGPPCQPFSLGGKARGRDDERDMFPSAIRAIRKLRPKVFVFENVKGLLRTSFREYLDYILLQLRHPSIIPTCASWTQHRDILLAENKHRKEEYAVTLKLVNAADYGVPQKRERIIFVGIRSDIETDWEFPQPTHSEASLLWQKYVTDEYWERHGISPSDLEFGKFGDIRKSVEKKHGMFAPDSRPWLTVRDALADIPTPGSESYFPDEHEVRPGAREYPGHTGSLLDEPSKTIKAGAHGVPGGENMIRFPDGTTRYLTVFEAKRIQTFPDGYHILGSWTEAMRQIGNAVPVLLAKVIGDSIVRSIFS